MAQRKFKSITVTYTYNSMLFKVCFIMICQIPPELASVLNAWPSLPEPVKAGILAMVQAAKQS